MVETREIDEERHNHTHLEMEFAKMMRSANALCLVAFIIVVAATTSLTTAAGAEAPAPSPASSPAAVEFLRGRCNPGVMPKVIASHCYESLLPQAGTFNGSCIRVIGAATELMVANFRSLLAELRRLDGTKYKLVGKCAKQAAELADKKQKEPEKLARIRALAAMGDDAKVEYVYDLVSWMDDVDASFDHGCQEEIKAIPDADKLLPTMPVMYPSILVAEYLVTAYTPPQAEMTPP